MTPRDPARDVDPRTAVEAPGTQQAPYWLGSRAAPALRRVLPSLFDRLCAAPGGRAASPREQRDQLRACVLRDLQALLNSANHEHLLEPHHERGAATSCWNYGTSVPAGMFLGGDTWQRIDQGIRQAIVRFEPRIIARSLKVVPRHDAEGQPRQNLLCFAIDGLIHDLPHALAFSVQSTIDLETRHVRFHLQPEAGGTGAPPRDS